MKETIENTIHTYMRVGTVFEVSFPDCQRTEAYYLKCLERIAGDPFYEAVEVTAVSDIRLREKVKGILMDSGMTVAYCAQPVILKNKLNLNSFDKKERSRAVRRMKECIDEACELGAESLSFLAGPCKKGLESETLLYLEESISEMCSYAQDRRRKLQIEIEVFDYDIDKRSLIGPSRRAAELAENLREKHDNFWILPDLSHIPQQHETIEEALAHVLPYMRRTHIGNCVLEEGSPVYGDCHPPFSYPGSSIGKKELSTYLSILADKGFLSDLERPMVSFEIKPLSDNDIESVLGENKKILTEAFEMLRSEQEGME